MPKCNVCRKDEAVSTWKERLADWFSWHLFPKTLRDEKTNSRLEGFAEGYKVGRKHEKELKPNGQPN